LEYKREFDNPLGAIWIAYLLATAAAIFTHYYALFAVVAQNIVVIALLRHDRRRLRHWLAGQAVLALSFLPWVLMQRSFLAGKASTRFNELTLLVLLGIVKRSLVAFSVGTTVQAPLAYYLALPFVLLAALGLVAALALPPTKERRGGGGFSNLEGSPSPNPSLEGRETHPGGPDMNVRAERAKPWQADSAPAGGLALLARCFSIGHQALRGTWLLLAWLVVPLIFAWLVNPIMPFFQERYLLISAPAFIILVAQGLGWLRGRWPWALAVALAFLVSASSLSLHNWFFDRAYTKGEYGLMMNYVRDRARPGDLLLLNNPLQEALFDYYRPPGIAHRFISRDDLRTEERANRALAALTAGYSRVWLVMFGYAEQYDPQHLAERWLSEHGYRSLYRSFLGAYLTLYVMPPTETEPSQPTIVAANLGDEVLLVGYSLSAGEIEAGETLLLTLYWQALAGMEKRYTVFTHLLDAHNRVVAQMDSEPLGGIHPTTECGSARWCGTTTACASRPTPRRGNTC